MAEIWITILIAGILTFFIRLSFIMLLNHWQPPPLLQRALRFVPPAVLCAIIFPEVLIRQGSLDISLGNLRLIAALAAVLVGWRTRNVLLTIASGLVVLYTLQWVRSLQ